MNSSTERSIRFRKVHKHSRMPFIDCWGRLLLLLHVDIQKALEHPELLADRENPKTNRHTRQQQLLRPRPSPPTLRIRNTAVWDRPAKTSTPTPLHREGNACTWISQSNGNRRAQAVLHHGYQKSVSSCRHVSVVFSCGCRDRPRGVFTWVVKPPRWPVAERTS